MRWGSEPQNAKQLSGLMDPASDEETASVSEPDHHHIDHPESLAVERPYGIGKWMYSALVCFFYAVSSTVITLVNKATFAHFNFHQSDILFLAQVCVSIIFLYCFRWCGWIEFNQFEFGIARKVILLSCSFVGMVLCGLMTLSLNNVPMYSALLRQTTLLVLLQEYLVLGTRQPIPQVLAVCIMCMGALIAAWNDLHGSSQGYVMGIVTCVFTSSYTIQMKRVTQTTSLKLFDIMLYNNVLSFPVILLYVVLNGGFEAAASFHRWNDPYFQLCFLLSASLAFVLNYSVFLCTHVNSPLTTSIVGNLKNLVTDVVGLFAFQDVSHTPLYLAGIGIATAGGLTYSGLTMNRMVKERSAQGGEHQKLPASVEMQGLGPKPQFASEKN
eukprot:c12055_g1_i1.p1 GENE.c12055_g1_i1~~c12055_g1_i1.p1  ORF type:complete len:406 (+),score=90.70 c12055_g1_i1:69-1220(+)